jgi:hypothetical protein
VSLDTISNGEYTSTVDSTKLSFYLFNIQKANYKPQSTKIKQQHVIGIRAFDSRLYLDISRSLRVKLNIFKNLQVGVYSIT